GIEVDDARYAQHVRHGGKASAEVVDRTDVVLSQRAPARVVDDDGDVGLILTGEIAYQRVIPLTCLVSRRQLVDVSVGQAQLQERRAGKEQKRESGNQDHHRAL